MNEFTKVALSFAAGVVVGALGIWLATLNAPIAGVESVGVEGETTQPGITTAPTEEVPLYATSSPNGTELVETATPDASVAVVTQPSGELVRITRVQLPDAGWVVVHETQQGFVGNALGAARRDAGVHEGFSVPLLRATTPGTQYWIVLYRDNGDREFSLRDDFPFRDTAGNPITASFSTQ